MRDNEILIACAGALDRFGEKHQILKAIEEMGELQQALAKYMCAAEAGGSADLWLYMQHVEEEIADVSLVVKQLRMIFDEKDIRRWEANKAEKLRQRTRGWRDPKLKRLVDDMVEPTLDEAPPRRGRPPEDGCEDGCEIRTE